MTNIDRTPVPDETEARLREIERVLDFEGKVHGLERELIRYVRDLQAQIKMLDDEVGILGEAARNEQNFRRALEAELRLARAVIAAAEETERWVGVDYYSHGSSAEIRKCEAAFHRALAAYRAAYPAGQNG